MPAKLTEVGRLAREHGLTLAGAKYRIAKDIPLDAQVNIGRKRAEEKNPSKRELARRYGLPYQTVCSRMRRGIPLDAPVMTRKQSTAKARKDKAEPRKPDVLDWAIWADFERVTNPLACMAVK